MGRRKLTDRQIRAIQKKLVTVDKNGELPYQIDLARKYGVTASTISHIKTGRLTTKGGKL